MSPARRSSCTDSGQYRRSFGFMALQFRVLASSVTADGRCSVAPGKFTTGIGIIGTYTFSGVPYWDYRYLYFFGGSLLGL